MVCRIFRNYYLVASGNFPLAEAVDEEPLAVSRRISLVAGGGSRGSMVTPPR
jgi:hypothetical protein